MSFAPKSWVLNLLIILALGGCSLGASQPPTDPAKRWVLIMNPMYGNQTNEPEYKWVEEDNIPSTLTTVLFGKKMIVAPASIVPKYLPPPGNGTVSNLQGGSYASAPRGPVPGRPPVGGMPPGAAPPVPTAVTPRGYVVYVDTTRVVIDLSVQQGLKVGDLLRVTREKIPLVHPVTGAYLGEFDEEIATVRIVELREKFAVAEIKEVKPGVHVQVKDRVVPRL